MSSEKLTKSIEVTIDDVCCFKTAQNSMNILRAMALILHLIQNHKTRSDKSFFSEYGINLLFATFFCCINLSYLFFQGILGSGFALQVAQNQREKHFSNRRIPAAILIQVHI